MYAFDGDPELTMARCADCGEEHEATTGFVLRDDAAYAVYWVAWYPHHAEAYVDLILGSWQEPGYDDHVTFGCRIGEIEGHRGPQCSLVHAAQTRPASPMFGTKLTRDDALHHRRVDEFWDCIDWLTINDPVLHDHVFHMD